MMRMLTTGASEVEYEQILADGLGLIRQQSLVDVSAARNRCRVAQLDLGDERFAQLEVGKIIKIITMIVSIIIITLL